MRRTPLHPLTQVTSSWVILAAIAVVSGCGGAQEDRLYVQAIPTDGEVDLPELPPPFTVDDIEALRDGFAWEEAEPLVEFDAQGRPALYYAEVYLRSSDDLDLLNLARVPNDALPLFEEERAAWDEPGTFGRVAFAHTEEGASLAYAFVPGAIYNFVRSSALEGEPVFQAIRLRTAPLPEASHAEGYLDMDYLIANGFTYGLSESELVASTPGDAASSTAPVLGRLFRVIIQIGRAVVDAFRSVANTFLVKRDFSLRVRVLNSSFFDDSVSTDDPEYRFNVMRQAWGERAGQPIRIQGAQVAVGVRMALDLARLNENGYVEARIARGQRVRVILRLRNNAAFMTDAGIWPHIITLYTGSGGADRDEDIALSVDVRSPWMNVFAQATDGYNYLREVAGRSIAHPAVVAVTDGSRTDNSSTPCRSFYRHGPSTHGWGLGSGPLTANAARLSDRDITIRGPHRSQRSTPTHEYGHFVMCSMLFEDSRRSFEQVWGDVTANAVRNRDEGRDDEDIQALSIAEGWADFFSSQVSGATLYFQAPGSSLLEDDSAYCLASEFGPVDPCIENNYGGPPGATSPANRSESVRDIPLVSSILFDLVDQSGRPGINAPSGAYLWESRGDFIPPRVVDSNTLDDEEVAIPGSRIHRIFHEWAAVRRDYTIRSFNNAVASAAVSSGATWNQVCDMFALHARSGLCTDLVNVNGGSGSLQPRQPDLEHLEQDPSCDGSPQVSVSWTNRGSVGTGYYAELLRDDDVVATWQDEYHATTEGAAGGRNGDWDTNEHVERGFAPLAQNTHYVLRVRTVGPSLQSEPLEVAFTTPASRLGPVTATAVAGGIRLAWSPVTATDYIVSQFGDGVGAYRGEAALTSAGSVVIGGLSSEIGYVFTVDPRNSAREFSRRCGSTTTRVAPLPDRIVHVSHSFGSDTAPSDGSALFPFATVAVALDAAERLQASQVRLEAGTFVESGPLTLPAASLSIEGGFTIQPDGAWARDYGQRSVVSAPASHLGAPLVTAAGLFAGTQATRTAVHVSRGANVVVRSVDLRATGTPTAATTCGVSVDVAAEASLRLEDATVATLGSVPAGACRIGLLLRGNAAAPTQLRSEQSSSVSGVSLDGASSVSANAVLIGVLAESSVQIRLIESAVYGLSRPSGVLAATGGMWSGMVATRSADISISRSEVGSAVTLPSSVVSTGSLFAMQIMAGGRVRIDNSFLHTATGATINTVLSVSGAGATGSDVEVVWSTLTSGWDFLGSLPLTAGASRALQVEGRVARLQLTNNVLSVANRHDASTTYVVALPVSSMLTATQAPLGVEGNAFSARSGAEMVHVACGEFAGCGNSEMAINDSSWFSLASNWSPRMRGNYALYGAVGIGDEPQRRRVYLSTSGEALSVDSSGAPAAEPTGTITLLHNGGVDWFTDPIYSTSLDGRQRSGNAVRTIGAYDILIF